MRRIVVPALLVSVVALSAVGAGDVLQQLSVSKADAGKEVVSSLAYGNVSYHRVRNAFKKATPSARAALTEQVLLWTKAYVASPQFAKDYAAQREDAKPKQEERISIDEELKQLRAERAANMEDAKKSVAQMPKEYRKAAEDAYKASVESMKQLDTPEFRKIERDGLVAQRRAEDEQYEERLQRWEEEFPADPRELVKLRLEEFLDQTEDVDYDAELVSKYGKMRFSDGGYERKPAQWKLAFRAGKETTEKARAFAKGWLAELQ
jgi:hypothetical protein